MKKIEKWDNERLDVLYREFVRKYGKLVRAA